MADEESTPPFPRANFLFGGGRQDTVSPVAEISEFRFEGVHGYRWPAKDPAKGVVQIVHGLGEHAGRYARLGAALKEAGWHVYASDLRGHGRTAGDPADFGFFAEEGGWQKCLDDLWLLNRRIAADLGRPIVMLGHSMGSFMVQDMMIAHGAELDGVVLSASDGAPSLLAAVG